MEMGTEMEISSGVFANRLSNILSILRKSHTVPDVAQPRHLLRRISIMTHSKRKQPKRCVEEALNTPAMANVLEFVAFNISNETLAMASSSLYRTNQ